MAPVISAEDVVECTQSRSYNKLPIMLQKLRSFPLDKWSLCIQTVLGWKSTEDEERENALGLLLDWGDDPEKWFLLLRNATRAVGGDDRFEAEAWMKIDLNALDAAANDGEKAPRSLLTMQQELWKESSEYHIAQKILERHPELTTYWSESRKRSIYHEAAKLNAPAILILAESVARKAGNTSGVKSLLESLDGGKKTPMAWAIHQSSPIVVEALFYIYPEIRVTGDTFRAAITARQNRTVHIMAYHRPELITMDRICEMIDTVEDESPDDPSFITWKKLFLRRGIGAQPDKAALPSFSLLHYAVERQHVRIVETLLQECPTMATQRDKYGRPVLWYNKTEPGKERTEAQETIRDLVATQIIMQLPRLDDIRVLIADDGKLRPNTDRVLAVSNTHRRAT
jgi:hypothetical protein